MLRAPPSHGGQLVLGQTRVDVLLCFAVQASFEQGLFPQPREDGFVEKFLAVGLVFDAQGEDIRNECWIRNPLRFDFGQRFGRAVPGRKTSYKKTDKKIVDTTSVYCVYLSSDFGVTFER